LNLEEFIRRFRLHLLPERFVKIRHFGLLANRHRHTRIAQARVALQAQPIPAAIPGPAVSDSAPVAAEPVCPHCHRPGLRLIRVTHAAFHRGLPAYADSS
jgi:hypothetical protein